MNADQLFQICSTTAMVGWLILIIVPFWKYTFKIVQWGIIPLLLGLLYLYLIAANFGSAEGGFDSLQNVMKLFENPNMVLAGWIHYLAFDLWVGAWEVGDARKRKIPHFLVIPCLLFTFFFGPIGLLMYILLRTIKTKKWDHDNF